MQVFTHHLYEYSKGLRRLVLHTTDPVYEGFIVKKLENRNIAYIIHHPSDKRMNVFFGDEDCIAVLGSFSDLRLDRLSVQQDFILGAMLGYDMKIQCRRYMKLLGEFQNVHEKCVS